MPVGQVFGSIYNSSGTLIPGSSVSAPGHTVINDGNGNYHYSFTTTHACTATASAPGYNPQTKSFPVVAGTNYNVNFNL